MDIKFACQACGQHLAIDVSCGGTTRNCPTCSAQVFIPQLVTQSPAPQLAPQSIRPKHQRKLGWGLTCGLIALGAISIAAYFISHSSSNVRARNDEAGDAYLAAKALCIQYAPAATNFTCDPKMPDYDHKGLWCSNVNPPHWSAMGYVDCEKRYGGSKSNLHQLWVAELVRDGEAWHPNRLIIGRETLYESP